MKLRSSTLISSAIISLMFQINSIKIFKLKTTYKITIYTYVSDEVKQIIQLTE